MRLRWREIIARRVMVDGTDTVFEDSYAGAATIVRRVTSADISSVRRKVTEESGLVRWVRAAPEHATNLRSDR